MYVEEKYSRMELIMLAINTGGDDDDVCVMVLMCDGGGDDGDTLLAHRYGKHTSLTLTHLGTF